MNKGAEYYEHLSETSDISGRGSLSLCVYVYIYIRMYYMYYFFFLVFLSSLSHWVLKLCEAAL